MAQSSYQQKRERSIAQCTLIYWQGISNIPHIARHHATIDLSTHGKLHNWIYNLKLDLKPKLYLHSATQ